MISNKQEFIKTIENFLTRLKHFKKEIEGLSGERIYRKENRDEAKNIANFWIEELQSPLEFRFKIEKSIISFYSELITKLHVLSRPNNRKSSYLEVLTQLLTNFQNNIILPINLFSEKTNSTTNLENLVSLITNSDEKLFLNEAIQCAQAGFFRASIVLGWCAVMFRIHSTIMNIGLDKFNSTSANLKNQLKGKFKNFNKEYKILSLAELQEISDSDILIILQGMNLIDSPQFERLQTCYQYRRHSAHPGNAPIQEVHVYTFFNDINEIIFQNKNFVI